MSKIAVLLKVDEEINGVLMAAADKLNENVGEVLVDLSAIRRVDPRGVQAMEEFVTRAHARGVKVAVRLSDVGVYKVLKLVKLAPLFVSVAWDGAPGQES